MWRFVLKWLIEEVCGTSSISHENNDFYFKINSFIHSKEQQITWHFWQEIKNWIWFSWFSFWNVNSFHVHSFLKHSNAYRHCSIFSFPSDFCVCMIEWNTVKNEECKYVTEYSKNIQYFRWKHSYCAALIYIP